MRQEYSVGLVRWRRIDPKPWGILPGDVGLVLWHRLDKWDTKSDLFTQTCQLSVSRIFARESCNVGNILWPAGSTLVSKKVVASDERDVQVVDGDDHASGPCVVELDTFNRGQDVNPIRWVAKLDDRIEFQEIIPRQPKSGKTECFERTENTFGILRAYPYPGIKITGIPRQSMGRNRVATDNEKTNVVSDERFDKLSEVRIEMHLLPQSIVDGELRQLRDAQSSMSPASRGHHQLRFRRWP